METAIDIRFVFDLKNNQNKIAHFFGATCENLIGNFVPVFDIDSILTLHVVSDPQCTRDSVLLLQSQDKLGKRCVPLSAYASRILISGTRPTGSSCRTAMFVFFFLSTLSLSVLHTILSNALSRLPRGTDGISVHVLTRHSSRPDDETRSRRRRDDSALA